MLIQTELRGAMSGGLVAHFAKCTIEGLARGCVPFARDWSLPPLYKAGIRFQQEPNHGSGFEDWALPNVVYARGWGDCDDLVIYRLWELHCQGVHATCNAEWVGNGVHVRVRLPNGTIEDPSILLGAC